MGHIGPVLAPALVILALAGCASGHKRVPTTTTTSASSTSTTLAASTTTSAASTASSTTGATGASNPETTTTARSGLEITRFTVSPASPVCNAPTSVQLQWNAPGATSVDLAIDGAKFATYAGGAQDHLEYFACDGKAHTYTLTAHSATATATATRTVNSTVG